MAETNEPRALSAALSAPAFTTRGAGLAMHVADRHVERWAPESGANRIRPMRSLGFVDRLIAPWIETAQRSASLRLFDQYTHTGFSERQPGAVSWLFPRPWYQDELDWMAAARRAPQQEASPTLFTTRGTYVSPQQEAARPSAMALPSALYEYVAPSMSIAQPAAVAGVGYGGESMHTEAYSPLIPLAAVQAAQLMARTVAPAMAPVTAGARMTPALRGVLSAMLERAAVARPEEPSRVSLGAPELVTPPAPRPPELDAQADAAARIDGPAAQADQVAVHYAAQRARIVELQRIAQRNAERELVARAESAAAQAQAQAQTQAAATQSAPSAAVAQQVASAARTAEIREAARRTEAQLRETAAGTASEEQRARAEADRTAERARIEERVAQRVAERTAERSASQRLHEQSRTAAAEDARAAIASSVALPAAASAPAPAPVRHTPPEVASAIAALPPELASFIGQRPERAMQAIEELDVALRTIELIARGTASGASFEATRGPRLVMPAGLGGLVAAVDRTTAWSQARAAGAPQASIAALAAPLAAPSGAAPGSAASFGDAAPARTLVARPFAPAYAAATRVPSLPWLAAAERPLGAATAMAPGAAMAGTSALAAAASSAPAALSHVAWADRWLARFAGASQMSLENLGAPARLEALAAAAPGSVFVAPSFDIERAAPARNVERLVAAAERMPTLIPPPAPVIRYSDEAETPDDVFAAISAGVAQQRSQPAPAPTSARGAASVTSAASAAATVVYVDRTHADAIASSAPAAPNAGLSAQLAASPFAPALRHVLPMHSAASFDVRSLFSGGLSAAFLSGLVSADAHELELAPRALPSWAAPGAMGLAALESFAGIAGEAGLDRAVPSWDAAYVSPTEPGVEVIAGDEAARDFAPVRIDAPVPGVSSGYSEMAPELAAAAAATSVATNEVAAAERSAQAMAAEAPLMTLRSALLSWSTEVSPMGGAPGALGWLTAETAAGAGGLSTEASIAGAALPLSTARAMLESMSLPMLGEEAPALEGGAWTSPGMVASRAHSWSVAQERSASDLALDFVTPELVLAARVYGLGPAEAAQAARLAIAGSGHLTAMAGTVDRAFMQAMAIDSDRRERVAALLTAYPVTAETAAPGEAVALRDRTDGARTEAAHLETVRAEVVRAEVVRAEIARTEAARAATLAPALAEQVPGGFTFGVERRAPRGAFLWPSASVAALGLNAAVPEGESAMSVAALELLAARAVAELGTFAALEAPSLGEAAGVAGADGSSASTASGSFAGASSAFSGAPGTFVDVGGAASAGDPSAALEAAAGSDAAALVESGGGSVAARRFASLAGTRRFDGAAGGAAGMAGAPGLSGEPSERDVLSAASELIPAARRGRFEALYLALGQSTAGRTWSPAARAARALALAGQTEDAPTSARERASAAWDVLPVVYASEGLLDPSTGFASETAGMSAFGAGSAPSAAGRALGRELRGGGEMSEWVGGYAGPGLSALSARAGEALGAYVSPSGTPSSVSTSYSSSSASSSSDSSSDRERSVAQRAPEAMQELVRTGRPAGRHGGGEAEIPPWFEAAARKMFENQGVAGDISLAELTLVTAAPSTHIAASTRTQPGAAPQAPSTAQATEKAGGAGPNNIDVEATAQEIYRYILTMMDAARARNGEPYL